MGCVMIRGKDKIYGEMNDPNTVIRSDVISLGALAIIGNGNKGATGFDTTAGLMFGVLMSKSDGTVEFPQYPVSDRPWSYVIGTDAAGKLTYLPKLTQPYVHYLSTVSSASAVKFNPVAGLSSKDPIKGDLTIGMSIAASSNSYSSSYLYTDVSMHFPPWYKGTYKLRVQGTVIYGVARNISNQVFQPSSGSECPLYFISNQQGAPTPLRLPTFTRLASAGSDVTIYTIDSIVDVDARWQWTPRVTVSGGTTNCLNSFVPIVVSISVREVRP